MDAWMFTGGLTSVKYTLCYKELETITQETITTMADTETLMRQYPILSAAWDECTKIWLGVEQDGTVHKFNRKRLEETDVNPYEERT